MNIRTSLACAFTFVCLSTSAWAQSDERGFVQGIGGMTFGTEAAPIFGGGFGVNVAPNFQITGEFGTMRDILPGWIQNAADDAALDVERLILLFLGERIDVGVDANAPAFYGMGGGRFVAPASGAARPFVGASVGFANVSPEIRLEIDGEDVTDEAIEDGFLPRFGSVTDLLVALGGGVNIAATRSVAVDIGYRYTRIFANQGINVHCVYGSVGYRF